MTTKLAIVPAMAAEIEAMDLDQLAAEGRRQIAIGKQATLKIALIISRARAMLPKYQEWLAWCDEHTPYGKSHCDKCVKVGTFLSRNLGAHARLGNCEMTKLVELARLPSHLLGSFLAKHPDVDEMPRDELRSMVKAWRLAAAGMDPEEEADPETGGKGTRQRDDRTPLEKLLDFAPHKLSPMTEMRFALAYLQRTQDSLAFKLSLNDASADLEQQFGEWCEAVKAGMDEMMRAIHQSRHSMEAARRRLTDLVPSAESATEGPRE